VGFETVERNEGAGSVCCDGRDTVVDVWCRYREKGERLFVECQEPSFGLVELSRLRTIARFNVAMLISSDVWN
jgi:hypothetical protein